MAKYAWAVLAGIGGAVVGGLVWGFIGSMVLAGLSVMDSPIGGLLCVPTGAAAGAGLAAAWALASSRQYGEASTACLLPTALISPLPMLFLAIAIGCELRGHGGLAEAVLVLLPSLVAVALGIALRRYRPPAQPPRRSRKRKQ